MIEKADAERIEAQAFAQECEEEFARFDLADEYGSLI